MSNFKERLQQIKDDYARHDDFIDWDDFMSHSYTNKHTVNLSIDEICKRYAEEVIKEASERAEISISGNENFLELLNSDEENDINSEDLANCKITVSKQSILNLIDEL